MSATITPGRSVDFADRLYITLLSLYPNRFRARFEREMLQIFRDCRRSQRCVRAQIALWLNTLSDFLFSLPRQWCREIVLEDSEIDYTGLIDLFMVTVVAGAHLLGWGWAAAGWTLNAIGYGKFTPSLLTGFLTLAMAVVIGILSVLFVVHTSRTECTRLKV